MAAGLCEFETLGIETWGTRRLEREFNGTFAFHGFEMLGSTREVIANYPQEAATRDILLSVTDAGMDAKKHFHQKIRATPDEFSASNTIAGERLIQRIG